MLGIPYLAIFCGIDSLIISIKASTVLHWQCKYVNCADAIFTKPENLPMGRGMELPWVDGGDDDVQYRARILMSYFVKIASSQLAYLH